ncbi:hypothetical protein [Herbaspirillum autotrophicum]|uniref:hypothetical protein n=1 Tax=Herbaspirillum autotrophicum TaxID=180195 RepID=UPI0012ED2788|nr:hypothetical protein [Herbaspirillum autotrophicum]
MDEKDNAIGQLLLLQPKRMQDPRRSALQWLAIIGGILTDYPRQFATRAVKSRFEAFAGRRAVFLHRSRKELAKTTVLLYSAVY